MSDNDTNINPMTDADVEATPEPTAVEPAKGPVIDASADATTPTQALKDNAGKYGAQAADKARQFADTGKDRATEALGQFSTMLSDAAGQVDERLGSQYGDYARNAAGTVQGFADQLQAKNVDDLIGDARAFVQNSPAMAVGIAAAIGFALARVVQSGLDGNKG